MPSLIDWSQVLPLVAGTPLQPLVVRLQSQQVPIRFLLIDNSSSTTDVLVYQGTSPIGAPWIVPAGFARAFPVSGTSAFNLAFPDTPTGAGSIYVYAANWPVSSGMDTKVVTALVGPITLAPGSTVAVSTLPTVTANPITPATDYPSTSTPFSAGGTGNFNGAGVLALATFTVTAGQNVYIGSLNVRGLQSQKISWVLQGGITPHLPHGIGDCDLLFIPPLEMQTTGLSLTLTLFTNDTPLGVTNVSWSCVGYIL